MTGKKPLFQKKGFLATLERFGSDSFNSDKMLYTYFTTLLKARGCLGSFYTVKTDLEQKRIIEIYDSEHGKMIKLTRKGKHIKELVDLVQLLLEKQTYQLRTDAKPHERKINDLIKVLTALLKGKDPFEQVLKKYSKEVRP
ncbi:MAG: hypothetical protein ACOC4M_07385 [Promethearchaeia archaeon]